MQIVDAFCGDGNDNGHNIVNSLKHRS